MSKINGEKARAAIERRRRTAQRTKDRAARAEIAQNPTKQAATKTKTK
jgi:hypothetical protein